MDWLLLYHLYVIDEIFLVWTQHNSSQSILIIGGGIKIPAFETIWNF